MKRTGLVAVMAAIAAVAATAVAAEGAALVGGPLVGHTTDASVRVWARADTEAEMVLAVSPLSEPAETLKSPPVRTLKANDFAAVAEVRGLKPSTAYAYDILLNGKSQLPRPLPSFATFPPAGKPAKVRVLFGGGIRFQVDPKQEIWNAMLEQEPAVFISMGDNVYPDNPITDEALFRSVPLAGNEALMARNNKGAFVGKSGFLFHRVYYRIQQSLPPYRRFAARVPTCAVWDDHDAFHDGTGGAGIPMPLRLESIQAFRENFANPYYGGGEKAPGTWCHFAIADLEFFLLDARTYRESGSRKERRFLGEAEEQWLKVRLLTSKAAFKFIVCGSPWNNQPKGGTKLTDENYYGNFGDTLASFKWHRDELLNFIIAKRIPGVILVSGDRHRAEVIKVWPRGQDQQVFYDLSNCNIASATHSAAGEVGENGLVYCFSGRCFGLLDIDTATNPATVTYEIWGTRGRQQPAGKVYTFTLEATDFLPAPRAAPTTRPAEAPPEPALPPVPAR